MVHARSFLKDLSVTFIIQITVTITGIVLLKLLSSILPEEGLGTYLVIRRFVALTFPLITLNLSMSLARFISFNQTKAGIYFFTSVVLCLSFFILWIILLPFYKDLFSRLIFGDIRFDSLVLPTIIFLFASSFQFLCVGLFRGLHDFFAMNIVNILFWIEAVIVLIIIQFFQIDFIHKLIYFFMFYSCISILVNCLIILARKKNIEFKIHFLQMSKIHLKKFLRSSFLHYGVKRLPSGFLIAGIFFVPVFAASSSISLKVAAYMGIIISIVRMIQLLGLPFNLLFLPKFSLFQSKGDSVAIKKYSQLVINYIFTLPLILGLLVSFLSREMILLWVGSKYQVVILYMQITGPFLVFFLSYVIIRGILDGISNYPYVNIITLISFLCIVIISVLTILFSYDMMGLTGAFCFGLSALGIFSIGFLKKIQNLTIASTKNFIASLWFLFSALILFLINKYLIFDSLILLFSIKLFISLVMIITSIIIYKFLKYEWLTEIKSRLRILNQNGVV